MRRFGPAAKFSTVDFERKHEISSRKMKNTRNFQNSTHSMSQNHQQLQVIAKFPTNITKRRFDFSEPISQNRYRISDKHKMLLNIAERDFVNVKCVQSVTIKGLELKTDSYYAIQQDDCTAK